MTNPPPLPSSSTSLASVEPSDFPAPEGSEPRFQKGPSALPWPAPPPPRPRWQVPLLLFVLTCASTSAMAGPMYGVAIMTILGAHEFGHYLVARRYRMAASLPYFLPMPISPLGTMGAVILMPSRISNVKALFDMAIAGPLAGLFPALICTGVGLSLSEFRLAESIDVPTIALGNPLIFVWMTDWILGATPEGYSLILHPLAFAGWVGIFITALNLIPISQLDGGHILYAMLKKKSYPIAIGLLSLAIVGTVAAGYWGWSLMIFLVLLAGPTHPPTGNDYVSLGLGRHLLGWLTLLFFILGFTPIPLTPNLPAG